MREMRQEARSAYRDCRQSGGSRSECRQMARNYWVNRASGGASDIPTEEAPRSDD
jgi:hypothetical protein